MIICATFKVSLVQKLLGLWWPWKWGKGHIYGMQWKTLFVHTGINVKSVSSRFLIWGHLSIPVVMMRNFSFDTGLIRGHWALWSQFVPYVRREGLEGCQMMWWTLQTDKVSKGKNNFGVPFWRMEAINKNNTVQFRNFEFLVRQMLLLTSEIIQNRTEHVLLTKADLANSYVFSYKHTGKTQLATILFKDKIKLL